MSCIDKENTGSENSISLVCCYNDLDQYTLLVDSVKKQTVNVTIFGIDNRDNMFSSMSQAYNSIINEITTKFVVFSHQDIILDSPDMMSCFLSYLNRIGENSILGVAGVKLHDSNVYTCTYRSLKKDLLTGHLALSDMEECFVVDECFFGGHIDIFKSKKFNEKICNNWHLYAVEICLRNLIDNNRNYICDIPLVHTSLGTIKHSFNLGFKKLCKEYAKYFPYIRTTCAHSKTNLLYRNIWYIKRELVDFLRK